MVESLSLASAIADVRFGIGGTAALYQSSGWSTPEAGFTWAIGKSASLRIPISRSYGHYLLILEGYPFLHGSVCNNQTLMIVANGREQCQFRVNCEFKRVVRLAIDPNRNEELCLNLLQPQADWPSKYGSPDERQLGFAWRRIRLIPTVCHRELVDEAENKTDDSLAAQPLEDNVARKFENTLLLALVSDRLVEAIEQLQRYYSECRLSLRYDHQLPDDRSLVRCSVDTSGSWTFGFPPSWLGKDSAEPVSLMIAWHLVASLPMLTAYARSGRLAGSFIMNLGDEAHARGISFCTNACHSLLVPDPYFMRSLGYKALKEEFSKAEIPFSLRKPKALWRGSSTGYHEPGHALELERVRLCQLAKKAVSEDLMDVGISNLVQKDPQDLNQLRALDIMKPYVPVEELKDWMFHIDVDGNTNSWPGLFQKLVSGGVVFKIESKSGWRQWYYDRLQPFVNFVPVSNDMADLTSKLKFMVYNRAFAESIGKKGQHLALEMSYERELNLTMSVLEDAIAQEH